jgi:hypothetical protein
MPFPFDPANSRVRVSETENGEFVVVGKVRSYDFNEGTEGGATLRWFGGTAKKAGDPTISATLPVWWDKDATGQDVLRAAKRAGTPIWLQFCPEGTEDGARVHQVQGLITQVSERSDSEGEAVEGSFTFDGDPDTLEDIELAEY